jgi:hypothetical protein
MSNKPYKTVRERNISMSIWKSPKGISISLPQKRYDKNQAWKKENKDAGIKPEFVESKSLFLNELKDLLACVQKCIDELSDEPEAGTNLKSAKFADDEIEF